MASNTDRITPAPRLVPSFTGHLTPDPGLQSLLSLLDDPSPAVWEPVFRALRRRGRSILGPLRAATRHENPILRSRARSLIESMEREKRLRRLVSYIARPKFRLETAVWLFSGLEMAHFDKRPFARELDDLAENVRHELKPGLSEFKRSLILPDYLGERFRFFIPTDDEGVELPELEVDYETHHPSKIFLHQVLAKRQGLPLSLGIIWKLVAFRLGLELDLVGIPGHVLVRVPSGPRRILVDPCTRGRTVSRREVREYLEAYDIPFGPSVFAPMNDRAIMRKLVSNYMKSMGMRGQVGRAEELLLLHALLDD
ncbi:MAG: transglutaminase-like domain-containing protein [Planctomycetota bacterium]|nr:transglutaminase-like domain-containing protein [Planctomycetota bacterium]MDG2142196.1 transglutaminase-like domain-containing protein [Planctomycetota bacterium]